MKQKMSHAALMLLYYGGEPVVKGVKLDDNGVARLYVWYRAQHDASLKESGKAYLVEFIQNMKIDDDKKKKLVVAINRSNDCRLATLGFTARIMTRGGILPEGYGKRFNEKLKEIIVNANARLKDEEGQKTIKEKVKIAASPDIGDIEEAIDHLSKTFDLAVWLKERNANAAMTAYIVKQYAPYVTELKEALDGKNRDLNEAYACFSKSEIKAKLFYVANIVNVASKYGEDAPEKVTKARKPRKKRVVTAARQVAKMKYATDDAIAGKSLSPTDIVGAKQVWVYNRKYRKLGVYNAASEKGFSVKGSTILDFDEKTSVAKKLRKPAETIKKVRECGRVALRTILSDIRAVASSMNGRINKETVIIRTVR